MPMEASSLIGSLGGIGEIAKEVFRSEARPAPQRQARRPPVAPEPLIDPQHDRRTES